MKFGGKLFVEEEFPNSKQDTPLQEVWAEKWRILKAAMILAGKFPYNEIDPEILAHLCRLAGFENVEWTTHTNVYDDIQVLDFFHKRLDTLLREMPSDSIRGGFSEMAANLRTRFAQAEGMEIPFYRLLAEKCTK